jgi:hypothetical protein
MKIITLFLILISFNSFASNEAKCVLVEGIYENSTEQLLDLKFETVADIFTMNNANVLSMRLKGEELRFTRTEMKVKKNIRMIYVLRKQGRAVRAAHIMIDRSPRQISQDREFYGNMIVSEEIQKMDSILQTENLVFNFYCHF